ncbi:zinc finger CCCH domain-containing protein 18 isoform X4 [Oncorhynchus mykiss]|uniref:zinc finger CCCH domain-containing protein 18 isoform X4 n=1 Tax=Oncorhynchus mykiss TaxID=8022 RepID=UPI0018775F1C|nr:zinc finger CCCH domain-containing protein 18 isoform X4 [Oncorhynchus mykiss]
MALNQDEIIEGMEIKMEVEEVATNSEVQVDVAGSEESDKALSNSNLATPKRGRGRPPKYGSASKSDNALSNCNPSTPKRGRPKGSVFMKTKMLKVIGLAAACLPRKPDDPSPKKRGRPRKKKRGPPSKVESTRKSLTPMGEEDRKLESQARRSPGRPRIYPRIDSPVTEPRGRGHPRKTEDATKSPIYDGPPRKRGRPPGAANKVKRGAEQDKDNGEPPVKRSFHAKDKTEEAGFPPVEESDQEDETGRVDQESEKWKVEYREDPKKPVSPSDPTSFLWASHITPKRGRPKGSVSKLLGSPITPNRGRPKGSVSKLLGSPITPNRGRPKGSVSKLLGSPITPKRGRPKGSVFTQRKILKATGEPPRGQPREVVDLSLDKHGRPSIVQLKRRRPKKRGRPKKILTPDEEEELKKLESQPRRPCGRPRIYPCDDSPVTEPRGKGPPRKRGRPPGAPNKVKRGAEQNKNNSEPPVKRSFHAKEKSEEVGFPPVEESDQEDETGRVDQESEKWKVEYREDPNNPVTPSDPTSFLWASHITPNRGRPKGSASKLLGSPITPNRGRPKGSVSKLLGSPITPNRGRPKGSVSKLLGSPITPNRGRPKGSVSKLLGSPITPNRGRPKGSVSKLLGSPITPNRGRPKGSVSKLLGSPITPNRGRPKGSVSKLLGSPITPNRGRPKGSVSKLLGSPITPNRGRPKGSVSKLLGSPITPNRGRPKGSVSKLLGSPITPNRGRPKGSVSKLLGSPITPNRGRPKGSVSKLLGSPITPNRGRPKGSVFTQPKILKVIGLAAACLPRKPDDPSPKKSGRPRKKKRGPPSKVESTRKSLTPKGEEDRKLESQARRSPGRPRIYPRIDSPVTEPRGRGRPRKRGRPPGAANKVKRGAEQDKDNGEPPVKCNFHSKDKTEEAGFPPVEESDQEDETGRVDEESETGKNIEKSPQSQLPPVTVIALSVP